MKALLALVLLAAASSAAAAQSAAATAGPHGLAVVKFNWSKERLNWEGDPFAGPNENFDQMRVRMRNEKRILDAKSGSTGNSVELNKVEREARADSANIERMRAQSPSRYGFVYKVTLRNEGDKPVRAVDWDYVFADAATGEELGRRQFTSEERIAPGKKKELAFFVASPPTRTVSADALNRGERDGLAERVVVVRVVYGDGTVWQPPAPAP
jgi:hypothetical protein